MNLLLRLAWAIVCARFRAPVLALGPCFTPFRCLPGDLDSLQQMNRPKAFSVLDVARADLLIRSRIASQLSRNDWHPIVEAQAIRFCQPLKLFDAFAVETTVLGWDEQAFVLQQRLWRKNTCVAEAVVRARVLKRRGGAIRPSEVLTSAGVTAETLDFPKWIREWNDQQKN